ncbi:MAG: Nramp family divalent metal transporter [Actinomycetota bacterium]|nr:Nramp family divalent metal transporter [Actinomycetota bacterium]
MNKILTLGLGILTAIGGFMDIGDLVTDALIGARFGLGMVWVTIVAVIGITAYSEMCGRVAAATNRTVFDLVRERLGERAALVNITGSYLVNVLTLVAELCGVALAFELVTDVHYMLWVPLVAFLAFLVVWKLPFEIMERLYGVLGLALFVFVAAVWQLGPDWGQMAHDVTHPTIPDGEGRPTYLFYAIVMLGAQMTPYEVFFFSSGVVEHGWGLKDVGQIRINNLIGYPIGGLLAIGIQATAYLALRPQGIQVAHLSQTVLPVVLAFGKVGFAFAIVGIFAAVFGSVLETLLASGYTVAHHFGWRWGKHEAPLRAARFSTTILVSLLAATAFAITTIDPIKITIYAVYLGVLTLPLTWLPVLVIANDRRYMGELANGRVANAIGVVYFVLVLLAAVAALPLLVATKGGL